MDRQTTWKPWNRGMKTHITQNTHLHSVTRSQPPVIPCGEIKVALLFWLDSWGLEQRACGGCAGCAARGPTGPRKGNGAVRECLVDQWPPRGPSQSWRQIMTHNSLLQPLEVLLRLLVSLVEKSIDTQRGGKFFTPINTTFFGVN